jgi:hypothetical protein
MVDSREQRVRMAAGEAVREVREDCRNFGGRPTEQVADLRRQAARSATVCADCFAPLAPTASVTMVGRSIRGRGGDRTLRVPICLTCWLAGGSEGELGHFYWSYEPPNRFRCSGCGRPMRVHWRRHGRALRARCCCEECFRKATLRGANERRRVRRREKVCAVCGEKFIPGKSNAKTCGSRCRQQLHRDRHLPVVLARADLGALRKGQRFIGRNGKTRRR